MLLTKTSTYKKYTELIIIVIGREMVSLYFEEARNTKKRLISDFLQQIIYHTK